MTSSGGSTGIGGGSQSADDLNGGDDWDDLDPTKFPPPTTPCDVFGDVEPPCDEGQDIVVPCNFSGHVYVTFAPRVNVDPNAIPKLVLLPLDGDLHGEGGQGGSAGARNETWFHLGTVSLVGPGLRLQFWIDPASADDFLEPLGDGYEPRMGVVALIEGGRILEQRRIFLFANVNCHD